MELEHLQASMMASRAVHLPSITTQLILRVAQMVLGVQAVMGVESLSPSTSSNSSLLTTNSCGQEGHFVRDCPEPKKNSGECYNCGQTGHNKADCPNERVERAFTGTCRICEGEGHRAIDCPQKPPQKFHGCGEEGHGWVTFLDA